MHRVAALGARPQAVALDRFQQHRAGLAAHLCGLLERGVDFLVVLTAALDGAHLLVRQGLHQFAQFGGVLHPVLTHHVPRRDAVHLIVPVHRLLHPRLKNAVLVAGQNGVPAAAPNHLDDMPVRAAEGALKLLNDLAVAAHRAVQALQVAVDHHHQVVQLLPAGDVDGAQDLRLVRLAVADERPDLAAAGLLQPAAFQILGEPRLVDGAGGGKAHAGGGHGPEPRQAARMRIGGQAAALPKFAAEVAQLRLRQAALQVGAGIDAGGGVRLEMHLVSLTGRGAGAKQMVQAHLHHGGGGQVGGDVAADAGAAVKRLQHHGHRVPADDVGKAGFQFDVARILRLVLKVDGVLVGRVEGGFGQHHPLAA